MGLPNQQPSEIWHPLTDIPDGTQTACLLKCSAVVEGLVGAKTR